MVNSASDFKEILVKISDEVTFSHKNNEYCILKILISLMYGYYPYNMKDLLNK
ncbi:MAG: hypothetical protein ACFFHD_15870 [Promethearchaeota archaeon]